MLPPGVYAPLAAPVTRALSPRAARRCLIARLIVATPYVADNIAFDARCYAAMPIARRCSSAALFKMISSARILHIIDTLCDVIRCPRCRSCALKSAPCACLLRGMFAAAAATFVYDGCWQQPCHAGSVGAHESAHAVRDTRRARHTRRRAPCACDAGALFCVAARFMSIRAARTIAVAPPCLMPFTARRAVVCRRCLRAVTLCCFHCC